MSKVEGGGPIAPPPLKASCNYFFLKASKVNKNTYTELYTDAFDHLPGLPLILESYREPLNVSYSFTCF